MPHLSDSSDSTSTKVPTFLAKISGLPGRLVRRIWAAVGVWSSAKANRLAAALSFYAAVSISPLLVLAMLALGIFLGPEAARGELDSELAHIFGTESSRFVQNVLQNASRPKFGSLTGILSALALLWGATNLFFQLQGSLNVILGSGKRVQNGFKGMVQKRLLSLGMILAIGFLLLISLTAGAILSGLSDRLFSGIGPLLQWINQGVSLIVITALFAAIYRILPDRILSWRQVGFGALITSVLFAAGKLGLTFYLGKGTAGSSYGIAGSVIVFLLWCYYSAQIFLFGAALVRAGLDEHKHEPSPD